MADSGRVEFNTSKTKYEILEWYLRSISPFNKTRTDSFEVPSNYNILDILPPVNGELPKIVLLVEAFEGREETVFITQVEKSTIGSFEMNYMRYLGTYLNQERKNVYVFQTFE